MPRYLDDPMGYARGFVDAYNSGSPNILPFYAREIDWREWPSGRRGDRATYEAALHSIEEILCETYITGITDFRVSQGLGALETTFQARVMAKPEDAPLLRALQVWIWQFDDDGMVTAQSDYFLPLNSDKPGLTHLSLGIGAGP